MSSINDFKIKVIENVIDLLDVLSKDDFIIESYEISREEGESVFREGYIEKLPSSDISDTFSIVLSNGKKAQISIERGITEGRNK